MQRGAKKVKTGKQVDKDLEQYRNLITLQKQMIERARKYERTKRECDALREPISKNKIAILPPPPARPELRPSAGKTFKGLPKKAVKKFGSILVIGLTIAGVTQRTVKLVGK
ncbi:MAG TPA: hypothetical protein VH255_01615 [Verrucomicrobiae bacterium]|jgi:hypothetical protein|nr:hypothetical protein [Verrucomicrobiae bacterium]